MVSSNRTDNKNDTAASANNLSPDKDISRVAELAKLWTTLEGSSSEVSTYLEYTGYLDTMP